MQEIGKKLQARRRELKLSYDDVAKMTRMPVNNIRAIEQGDIDYFQDDITYLRFYVRAYCKALDVPFDEFKEEFTDSVNEYTQTMIMKKADEQNNIEQTVQQRVHSNTANINNTLNAQALNDSGKGPKLQRKDRNSIKENMNNTQLKTKRKLDLSMVSLIVVIVLVIALVVFVLFKYVFNGSSSSSSTASSSSTDKTTETTPTPEKTTSSSTSSSSNSSKNSSSTTKSKTTTESKMVIAAGDDATTYNITGLKVGDSFNISITASADCWIQATYNDSTINTMTGTFSSDTDPATYTGTVTANDVFEITFGNFKNCTITINGQPFTPDSSIQGTSSQTLTFNVTGEQ